MERHLTDKLSKEKRSKLMSKIKSKNTQPELFLRKSLRAAGFRYRVHYGSEKIDIAIPSKKIAIFVDGCFWHGCPLHSHLPKSNTSYWKPKLLKNIERDKLVVDKLNNEGWHVLRVWEHDATNKEVQGKVKDWILEQQSA